MGYVQVGQKSSPVSYAFTKGLKKWRSTLSRIVTACIPIVLIYWGWHHRLTLLQVFDDLGPGKLTELCFLLTLGILLAAWSFTILVRSMGYRFTYQDGYHSLNLSQIAAMVPGKIWGFTGLVGLLWSRGVSKSDSVLVILLHTILMLSAAVLVGMIGLIPTIGWSYTLLCLIPILVLVAGRSWCDTLRSRHFSNSSALPSSLNLLAILIAGFCSWIVISACFAILVYSIEDPGSVSPFLVASAFAAGYVGGFVSPITLAGLGVREGIITLILGSSLGSERVLAVAIVFRCVHMAVLWFHIAITSLVLSFGIHTASKDAH